MTEHTFILPDFSFSSFSYGALLRYSTAALISLSRHSHKVRVDTAEAAHVELTIFATTALASVRLSLTENTLRMACTCAHEDTALCEFQYQALLQLLENRPLRIFFDPVFRTAELRKAAATYGLPEDTKPEDFFRVTLSGNEVRIEPMETGLIAVTAESLTALAGQFLPPSPPVQDVPSEGLLLVWTQNRFQDSFQPELFEAVFGAKGKPKNPLTRRNPLDLILEKEQSAHHKFYGAVARFQNAYRNRQPLQDREALKWIIRNPEGIPSFLHLTSVSETISANSLRRIKLAEKPLKIHLTVHQNDAFYELTGQLTADGRSFDLEGAKIRFDYFLHAGDVLYLIPHEGFPALFNFLRQHQNRLVIHENRYEIFRKEILEPIEAYTTITYTYLKPATRRQLRETGFDAPPQSLVYLDDSGQYIHLTPVVRYGNVEIPVMSTRVVYGTDSLGRPFACERDEVYEDLLLSAVVQAHPSFAEQNGQDFFYLHKSRFMEDNWFLQTFETWRSRAIEIRGFNRLKNNRLSSYKAAIRVHVINGTDWFDTKIELQFGTEKVPLRKLVRALRNNTRYIELDDGTLGILPEAWLLKFRSHLEIAVPEGEALRTPRIHFSRIGELYDHTYLAPSAIREISELKEKLGNFGGIQPVEVPEGLQTILRDYQREGLAWLNFLDEIGFGGCLADDMGLGKTLQVIAFLLLLKQKRAGQTSLVVVPASLLFNWQQELEKFAPSLNVFTFYGNGRYASAKTLAAHDVVLTTYATLVTDVRKLRAFSFAYAILDESQHIKNPDSQRYKAACQLQARNRIVLTGTPLENNSWDLYGQFSFACPGLLGSRMYFRDHFFTPLDKFEDPEVTRALQQRIRPFLLRRTKEEVTLQLPGKTEMIVYCEMAPDQRKVYDAYADAFRKYLNHTNDSDIFRERMHILQGLTKLRQICNAPSLLRDEEYYGASSAKLDILLQHLENLSGSHKILVFSQFVSMLELVRKALDQRKIPYAYLTGQTRNRQQAVTSFQDNTHERVFLISLKAGGVGLNLTAADYVFLVDPWWNPAVENQAVDRVHRIGQERPVVAVRLVCPDTLEEKILNLQASKKELFDGLVKSDNTLFRSLSRTELLSLLS